MGSLLWGRAVTRDFGGGSDFGGQEPRVGAGLCCEQHGGELCCFLFTVGCAVAVIVTSFYSSAALTGCFKLFQA